MYCDSRDISCGWWKDCKTGALGAGGPTIDLFYLPTGKIFPKHCTLAATWFCVPGPCCCIDFVNTDTMLRSVCFFFPQVYRKTKQLDVIWQRPKTGCCAEY